MRFIKDLAEEVEEQRKIDRARKAIWRHAYYNDPDHPERRARKNFSARECNRKRREAGLAGENYDLSTPKDYMRQTLGQLDRLNILMAGRKYG